MVGSDEDLRNCWQLVIARHKVNLRKSRQANSGQQEPGFETSFGFDAEVQQRGIRQMLRTDPQRFAARFCEGRQMIGSLIQML
jgi:hypothetical protein